MFDKSLAASAASTTSTTICCTTWASRLTPGFEEYGLWDFCAEKKAEGKIKKFGFSIHDNAEELEKVLDAHPEVDFVQLQINYIDWESPIIQSRTLLRGVPRARAARGHHGAGEGRHAREAARCRWPTSCVRPSRARPLASWALRFAGSLPNVIAVLSGMNTPEMVAENARHHARWGAPDAGRARGDRGARATPWPRCRAFRAPIAATA